MRLYIFRGVSHAVPALKLIGYDLQGWVGR